MKFAPWMCLLLFAAMATAQTAQPAGVSSEWDVRKLLEGLDLLAQHLKPIIDQVKPEAWVAKGAPDAYVAQWKSAQAELRYLLSSSTALSKDPERLTLALDTYLRMQAMESTLGSLVEGIRKYQNPALADLAQSVVAENSNNRDRLSQYLTDLAAQKEQEFKVADREAQRCRGLLLNQPAPQRKTSRP
ncbi:MAG: hypothetical protein LAP38_18770 [Acidobacteriia bacterium]|nr:hypothetical protein [Terriglobia bacterium]